MKTDIAYIYALIDPRNNKVRYVGKSTSPRNRKYQHISERLSFKHHKANWIQNLYDEGLRPEMKILEVCPLENFEERESYHISLFNFDDLTNSDVSGQGNKNRRSEIILNSKYRTKKVYQFNLNGDFLNEYKSVREAARILNLSHANITRCCNGIWKHNNGFIFSYNRDVYIYPILKPNAVKKSVVEIDDKGDIIKEWKSLMDCSRDTGIDNGNLSRVCNNILKHIKNRRFCFKQKCP